MCCSAAIAGLWAAALVALAACGGGKPTAPNDLLGHAALALNAPNPTAIKSIDYTIVFTYLESDPPDTYSTQEYTSALHGGQLITILPCRTGTDGTGYNQADVDAVVHFVDTGLADVTVHASAVFECVRNADTRVNILLNIAGQLNNGFGDLVIAASGTFCAQKIDFKPDTYLGVCADSTCGDATAVFLFANTCHSVSGGEPVYWLCGAPTDWNLTTSGGESVAISYFSVPDGDGRWEFGLIALDPMRMAQDDPTLTDGDGYLRVWTGIASTRAVLERENGQNTQNVATSTMLDFAAQLDVPPQAAGQPSPRVLVFGSNSDEGVTVAFQTKFGACEQPVQGTALYDGFRVADVRLDGTSKVRLLLTDQFVTFVKSVATCEAGWDAANRPTVTCGPPGPLF